MELGPRPVKSSDSGLRAGGPGLLTWYKDWGWGVCVKNESLPEFWKLFCTLPGTGAKWKGQHPALASLM